MGISRLRTSILLCRRKGKLQLVVRSVGTAPLGASAQYSMIDVTPQTLHRLGEIISDAKRQLEKEHLVNERAAGKGKPSDPLECLVKAKRIIAIVAAILAVALVFYLKILHDEVADRLRDSCIRNLQWIAGAKDALVHEQGLKPGTIVSTEIVAAYVVDGWRNCPAGGKYTVNPIGQDPTCNIPGHSLAP